MYSVQRTIILGDHYKISEHHQFPWCHTSFIKPNFIGRFSWYHLIGFHDINKMNCELMLTYDTPALWQTGSRNLTGQKTLPTIWGTYMTLVTKYQISVTNSCWEKCDEKCAYMFNVYKDQLSRQTGSRNLMGPKTLSTIWYTYMMLVTKYQISAINSYWEKCDEKYLGRTDGQTDRGKTVYPLPLRGAGV
jgi:carbon starvation protein CstA